MEKTSRRDDMEERAAERDERQKEQREKTESSYKVRGYKWRQHRERKELRQRRGGEKVETKRWMRRGRKWRLKRSSLISF